MRVLGIDCQERGDGNHWSGQGEGGSRVRARKLEDSNSWLVEFWLNGAILVDAERGYLQDAENACAMKMAYAADAIRQVAERFFREQDEVPGLESDDDIRTDDFTDYDYEREHSAARMG